MRQRPLDAIWKWNACPTWWGFCAYRVAGGFRVRCRKIATRWQRAGASAKWLKNDWNMGLVSSPHVRFFVYDPNEEKLLTPSMVNNYVKMKLLPAPQKKKYGRKHIALLIMICTFKQSLSMAAVEQMLPPDDEDAIRADYERFIASHKRLALYFIQQVRSVADPIYNESIDTGTEVNDLVVGAAIASSFTRLLAGKIIALKLPEEPNANPDAAPEQE